MRSRFSVWGMNTSCVAACTHGNPAAISATCHGLLWPALDSGRPWEPDISHQRVPPSAAGAQIQLPCVSCTTVHGSTGGGNPICTPEPEVCWAACPDDGDEAG